MALTAEKQPKTSTAEAEAAAPEEETTKTKGTAAAEKQPKTSKEPVFTIKIMKAGVCEEVAKVQPSSHMNYKPAATKGAIAYAAKLEGDVLPRDRAALLLMIEDSMRAAKRMKGQRDMAATTMWEEGVHIVVMIAH